MRRKCLLIVTALGEGGTGLAVPAAPEVVVRLLLGGTSAAGEVPVVGRVAGGALLAIGIACWLVRNDGRAAQAGVLAGVLVYDVVAAVVLAYAGSFSDTSGIALWPAVVIHTALAVWAVACLTGSD